MFKGGIYGAKDWNNPDACLAGSTHAWPQRLDGISTQTVTLRRNFNYYLSPTWDSLNHDGGADGELFGGKTNRPAGTLTWAVVSRRPDPSGSAALKFDYVKTAVYAQHLHPMAPAPPDDSLTLTTHSLALYARLDALQVVPGPSAWPTAGTIRFNLNSSPTAGDSTLGYTITLKAALNGMKVRLLGYGPRGNQGNGQLSHDMATVTLPTTGLAESWTTETLAWPYAAEMSTATARTLEDHLLASEVFVEVLYFDGQTTTVVARGQIEPDWDDDGLTDREETQVQHTDPRDRDTDDDGLLDGEEALKLGLCGNTLHGCDPLRVDTEGDLLADGLEVGLSTSTLVSRIIALDAPIHQQILFSDESTTEALLAGTTASYSDGVYRTGDLALVDKDATSVTDPSNPDTDGDGFWDGPDAWAPSGSALMLHAGEDKNANGKYEMLGSDGEPDDALASPDDESDPCNPTSRPDSMASLAVDDDRDGLSDELEAELGTNPNDADSDDDGVKDGDEVFVYHTNPINPDTDLDGLPDGFELGLTYSSDGSGRNEYNTAWFDDVAKDNGYIFSLRQDPAVTYKQITFLPLISSTYRSDPNCVDSDMDGVWDLAEFNANPRTDPMRGLVRKLDTIETTKALKRLDLPDFVLGSAPVNNDYQIFLNKVLGEDNREHWETVLPISLGRTPTNSVIVSTIPTLSLLKNERGEYVSSITVTQAKLNSYMGRFAVMEIPLRCTDPLPETLQIAVDRGGGDVRTYSVGLNSYYVDYH